MFKLFVENDLISSNQSGFKPGSSCINQALPVTHEIYNSFDCGYEVRGFIFISRKLLTRFGTTLSCLNVLTMTYLAIYMILYRVFLYKRKQRVVLQSLRGPFSHLY